jgi:hypothetical protein
MTQPPIPYEISWELEGTSWFHQPAQSPDQSRTPHQQWSAFIANTFAGHVGPTGTPWSAEQWFDHFAGNPIAEVREGLLRAHFLHLPDENGHVLSASLFATSDRERGDLSVAELLDPETGRVDGHVASITPTHSTTMGPGLSTVRPRRIVLPDGSSEVVQVATYAYAHPGLTFFLTCWTTDASGIADMLQKLDVLAGAITATVGATN